MVKLSLCVLMKTHSGEGSSTVPVPGHRCSDEKPLAEVFPGSCFLLLPGLCGGRQPSCGHAGPTTAGYHQEAGPAGDPKRKMGSVLVQILGLHNSSKMCITHNIELSGDGVVYISTLIWAVYFPGVVLVPGLPVRHCCEGSAHHPQQTPAAALPEEGYSCS